MDSSCGGDSTRTIHVDFHYSHKRPDVAKWTLRECSTGTGFAQHCVSTPPLVSSRNDPTVIVQAALISLALTTSTQTMEFELSLSINPWVRLFRETDLVHSVGSLFRDSLAAHPRSQVLWVGRLFDDLTGSAVIRYEAFVVGSEGLLLRLPLVFFFFHVGGSGVPDASLSAVANNSKRWLTIYGWGSSPNLRGSLGLETQEWTVYD